MDVLVLFVVGAFILYLLWKVGQLTFKVATAVLVLLFLSKLVPSVKTVLEGLIPLVFGAK